MSTGSDDKRPPRSGTLRRLDVNPASRQGLRRLASPERDVKPALPSIRRQVAQIAQDVSRPATEPSPPGYRSQLPSRPSATPNRPEMTLPAGPSEAVATDPAAFGQAELNSSGLNPTPLAFQPSAKAASMPTRARIGSSADRRNDDSDMFPVMPVRRSERPIIRADRETHAAVEPDRIATEQELASDRIDLNAVLLAANETAYSWNLRSDRIVWQSNAAAVLQLEDPDSISTGSALQQLVASEDADRRFRKVTGGLGLRPLETPVSPPLGQRYCLQYRLQPRGRRGDISLWVEDQGEWLAAADGRPALARGVIRRIDERRAKEERLIRLSEHDELTGQKNRARLTLEIENLIEETKANGSTAAFVVVAINNLSIINETFGFDTGDAVIATIGQRLAARLRFGDHIGRLSANRFGITIADCATEGLRAVARRFFAAVRELPIETNACQIAASLSIGGVLIPDHAADVAEVIACGLEALDQAKATHRDSLVVYAPSPRRDSARKRNVEIAEEVISALADQRMKVALQPIVRTDTYEPALYECLLRMERPDGEIISAGEFITVAEQLGMSRLIDQRMLELAVGVLRDDPDIRLSVNVSGLTAADHDWLVNLQRLTGGDRRLTSRLMVEITETSVIEDLDQSIAFVDSLKELGCSAAIDDFGAGYTSFFNLRHLGAEMVKIDGAFITNLMNDSADRIFVETLINLASKLGLETVAECVGDEATAQLLAEYGITYMQGYYFGRPDLVLPSPLAAAHAKAS